jgi:TRAP-type C4-dicarboxylate transport system permease small subunit
MIATKGGVMTKEGATLIVLVMLFACLVLLVFGIEISHLVHHVGDELKNISFTNGN